MMTYHTYLFRLNGEPVAVIVAHSERQARIKLEAVAPARLTLEEDEEFEAQRVAPGQGVDLR